MFRFNPTTFIQFYAKSSTYVSGIGQTSKWDLISSITKPATETEPEEKVNIFYGEWRGSYGDRAVSAEAVGVKDSATIRTFYVPTICEKLKKEQVIIIKNADSTAFVDGVINKANLNVFELWGGVDNVENANMFMEFKVRRYEGT